MCALVLLGAFLPFVALAQNVCVVANTMCPEKPPSGTPCTCPVAGFTIIGVCSAPKTCTGTGISGALAGFVQAPSSLTTVGLSGASQLVSTLFQAAGVGGGGGTGSDIGSLSNTSFTSGTLSSSISALPDSFFSSQSSSLALPDPTSPTYFTEFNTVLKSGQTSAICTVIGVTCSS